MSDLFIRGKVIRIIDEQRLVVNVGAEHGVRPGDRFHLLELGEEVFDPESQESLGRLEMVKGAMEAVHVQEKMTLLTTIKNPQQSSGVSVLSATLAQTSSAGRPETDPSRLSLRIRYDQAKGYSLASPVGIGDWVRTVYPMGETRDAQSG